MGDGGRFVSLGGDEIPLLSWSLHLLGEAEWAVVRAGSFNRFSSVASRLNSCVEARAVSVVEHNWRLGRWSSSFFFVSGRERGRISPVCEKPTNSIRESVRWRDPG